MGPILQVDIAALQQLSADLSRIADQISGIDSAGPIFEASAALNSSAVTAVSIGNADVIADAYRHLATQLGLMASGTAAAAGLYDAAEAEVVSELRGAY
ncbi:hypothetical protein ACIQYW_25310 [Rhodococcus erythropolis]|jgi:hypothetical protein|uniref:hypothetical protein n=1 Tax=Rhodococcus TaxID=1827 RepID=UPI000F5B25CC|nr:MULTISPECIES: hypothetical protein [Rhodococcus]RQO50788.1 hypothetical protein DBV08_04975 [Rhodococcus sp. KBW08]UJC76584.1 hypothetical protein D4768_02040 [Rhodococcus erythropolis]